MSKTTDSDTAAILKSLVALVALGKNGDLLSFYSGFVCIVGGQWLWCTASHVLQSATELSSDGMVSRWGLVGTQASDANFIDFAFGAAERIQIPGLCDQLLSEEQDSSCQGFHNLSVYQEVDIGCVFLHSQLYIDSLHSTGVQPLTEANLVPPATLQIEDRRKPLEFFMFGLPESAWQRDNPNALTAKMLRVLPQKIDGLILEFIPDWPEDLHSGHVKGMSGGPVVAYILDRPFVIGVQMSQFGTDRRVSYLRVADSTRFFEMLKAALDDLSDVDT